MTKETKLVSKRRFSDFESLWNTDILGHNSEILTGGTPRTEKIEYWNPKQVPWMSSGEINKERINNTEDKISELGLENSSAQWVEENSILIALAGQGKTRGRVAINNIRLTTNQSVAAIIPKQNLYSEFIFQNLNKRYEELRSMSSGGGARGGLNKQLIFNISLSYPTMEEQQKIGEFFKVLDERIANQERKIAKVKALKSACLTEMFPQVGETVPRRRFNGFEGEWKECGLLEQIESIVDFRGRTPKKLGLDWSKDGYLALSAINVKNGYIDFEIDAHYGNQELYNKWMQGKELKKGQVLFTTEAPMGNVAQVPDNRGYILSQRTIAFVTNKKKLVDDFLAVLLRSNEIYQKLISLSSGGTAIGVSQKSLENLKVTIPIEIKEQQKIGSFFKNIDGQIMTEEKKLKKLKEMKEAYLEEMFV